MALQFLPFAQNRNIFPSAFFFILFVVFFFVSFSISILFFFFRRLFQKVLQWKQSQFFFLLSKQNIYIYDETIKIKTNKIFKESFVFFIQKDRNAMKANNSYARLFFHLFLPAYSCCFLVKGGITLKITEKLDKKWKTSKKLDFFFFNRILLNFSNICRFFQIFCQYFSYFFFSIWKCFSLQFVNFYHSNSPLLFVRIFFALLFESCYYFFHVPQKTIEKM